MTWAVGSDLWNSGKKARFALILGLSVLFFLVRGSGIDLAVADEKAIKRNTAADVSPNPMTEQVFPKGNLYALVVGVAKYRDSKLNLKYADRDARALAGFLQGQKKLFKNLIVKTLVDEQATRAEILRILCNEFAQVGKDDTVILFFSGHGTVDRRMADKFFFVAYDTDTNNLHGTGVDMTSLDCVRSLDADRVWLIADSCHSGGLPREQKKATSGAFDRFVSEFGRTKGRAILTSCRGDEYSREADEFQHGVFTHYLIEALKGKAKADNDGTITVEGVYQYVYDRTNDYTKGGQHAQRNVGGEGSFPVAHVEIRIIIPVPGARPQKISTGSLALRTDPGRVRVLIGALDAGESAKNGLLTINDLQTDLPLTILFRKEGFKERRISVTIPSAEAGRAYQYPDDIRLDTEDGEQTDDPVVGKWAWFNAGRPIFLPKGKIAEGTPTNVNSANTWTCLDPKQKVYQFTWGGKWIDTLTLSSDGSTLSGTNQNGSPVAGYRLGYQPTEDSQRADDPVVGKWAWFNAGRPIFLSKGKIAEGTPTNVNPANTWTCLDPKKRLYQFTWEGGKWIDTLTLSLDGSTLSGTNQNGSPIAGARLGGQPNHTIVGKWAWINGGRPIFLPNGRIAEGTPANVNPSNSYSWKCLDKNKRLYRFVWGSNFIDTLSLSPDGATLSGTNNYGNTITGIRLR